MTIDQARRYLYKVYISTKNSSYSDALSFAIAAIDAQIEAERTCSECIGILYYQTNSGKIIPCDKICAGKIPQ